MSIPNVQISRRGYCQPLTAAQPFTRNRTMFMTTDIKHSGFLKLLSTVVFRVMSVLVDTPNSKICRQCSRTRFRPSPCPSPAPLLSYIEASMHDVLCVGTPVVGWQDHCPNQVRINSGLFQLSDNVLDNWWCQEHCPISEIVKNIVQLPRKVVMPNRGDASAGVCVVR